MLQVGDVDEEPSEDEKEGGWAGPELGGSRTARSGVPRGPREMGGSGVHPAPESPLPDRDLARGSKPGDWAATVGPFGNDPITTGPDPG